MITQPLTPVSQELSAGMMELRDLILGLIEGMPTASSSELDEEFRTRYEHLASEQWNKRVDEETLWLESQIKRALAKRAAPVAESVNRFLQIANRCVERGEFRILPIAVGGKNPLIKWKDTPLDTASTTEWLKLTNAHIQEMSRKFPEANACVVAKPGEFLFLDIDTMKEFHEAYEKFSGEPYPKIYATSGRENRCQEHLKQTDATRKLGNIAQFKIDGIDFSVRQHNLYVLAEGSTHPKGGIYKRIVDAAIAPMPDKLVAFIKHLCEKAGKKSEALPPAVENPLLAPNEATDELLEAIVASFKKRKAPEGIDAGGHNIALASLAGDLRRAGATREQMENLLLAHGAEICPDRGERFEKMCETIAASISRYQVGQEPPFTVGGKKARKDVVPKTQPNEKMDANVQVVESPDISDIVIARVEDMPEDCLAGRLGEAVQKRMKDFPVAYSWLTLVVHAAQFVPIAPLVPSGQGVISGDFEPGEMRNNLYFAPVGPVHGGKSMAGEFSRGLLGMDEDAPPMLNIMPGSAEGLIKLIANGNGRSVLVNVDELGFLLERAALEGASFPYILNRSYYKTAYTLTTAGGKAIDFNCRLSLLGGVTLAEEGAYESFGDLFGSQTVGGMYDRTLFGLQPSGHIYDYRPFSGGPLGFDLMKLQPVKVGNDVWEAKSAWVKEYKLSPRVLESCLRVAAICASYDGRNVLRPKDIEVPVVALAKYQENLRLILCPNTGKNDDGKLSGKFLGYLRRHAPNGEWLSERDMLRNTRAYDFGTRAERVLASLHFNGEVERGRSNSRSGPSSKAIRLTDR